MQMDVYTKCHTEESTSETTLTVQSLSLTGG